MQLYSQELEIKCIVTLTSDIVPEQVRSTLLGNLRKEFFHFPPCVTAFNRISTIAKKRYEMLDFSDLISDPAIEEDFRDIFKDSDTEPCKSRKTIRRMVTTLDQYRKMRIVYDMSNSMLDSIEGESVNIDSLLDKAAEALAHARRDLQEQDEFVIIGENGNAEELVEDVLYKVRDELIKTGFKKYDIINGGVPDEGVMLLAATTSGGKSAMLMNLMKNFYLFENKRVCRVSLEMGDRQEMSRLLSNISGVPFSKIKQHKTSPKEKQRIKKAFKRFNQHGEQNNCVYNTVSPTRSMTIDDCLRSVKPFGYDVVGIDYVSLLEDSVSNDQWKALNEIIRVAKTYSRETKCLVIILCQLDADSDRLRYSKGMKEHADVMWSWNYSNKEQRELRILPVKTDKARDGELVNFDLSERFDIMDIGNMDEDSYSSDSLDEDDEEEEYGEDDESSRSRKNKGKKGNTHKNKRKSVKDEDDDSDSNVEVEENYALS